MRFREFKPSILEFAPPAANDEISQLVSILRDPTEDSELKNKVTQLLTAMLNDIESGQQPEIQNNQPAVQQQKTIPQQSISAVAPISENLTASLINRALANKEELLQVLRSDPVLSQLYDELMADKEREVRTAVKVERKAGEAAVRDIVVKIINKKFAVAQEDSARVVIEAVENLIRDGAVPYKRMMEFLELCDNSGVIKTGTMISGRSQTGTIPLVSEKYQDIVARFLEITGVKVGNAQWGGGEVGLAFCGISARKETSDISIGKKHIEVKAGGGNTDFFLKGTKGFGTQVTALETLITALNGVAEQNNLETFALTNKSKEGGISQLGYKRLNGAKNVTGINPYFLLMGKKSVENLLITILSQVHASAPEIVDKYQAEIKGAVNKDGSVDYHKLIVPTSKISFEYYETMENHDGLLLLNIPNFSYVYVSKGNAKQFGDLVGKNQVSPTSAIDFRGNSSGGISYKIRV